MTLRHLICTPAAIYNVPNWFEWDFRRMYFGSPSFAGPLDGWIDVGSLVLHTTNGGRSWEQVDVGRPGRVKISAVVERGNGNCICLAIRDYDNRPTRFPVLSVSLRDRLKNCIWVGSTNGYFSPPHHGHFIDSRSGWIVVVETLDHVERSALFQTLDCGETWERIARLPLVTEKLHFHDLRHGWRLCHGVESDPSRAYRVRMDGDDIDYFIGGYTSLLERTADGGRSWSEVLTVQQDLHDLAFTDRSAVAVGSNGCIFASLDRGSTWKEHPQLTGEDLYALCLRENGLGLAVGNESTILLTEDLGNSWALCSSDLPPLSLHGVHLIDESTGILVATDGIYSFVLDP